MSAVLHLSIGWNILLQKIRQCAQGCWVRTKIFVNHFKSYQFNLNKKVLLRERKRHTARRVASPRYAVPVGGTPPPPSWDLTWMGEVLHPAGGGTPSCWREGVTPSQVWTGGAPHSAGWGTPTWTWEGVFPCQQDWVPWPWQLDGVPPTWTCEGGTPSAGWGTPTWTWEGVTPPPPVSWMGYPPSAGWGTPPPASVDRHLWKQYLPYPADAGDRNW